jgi:hypothetical protein
MPPPPPRPLPLIAQPEDEDDTALEALRLTILQSAKTLAQYQELPFASETKVEQIQRFMNYTCNFKKHKGRTWQEVIEIDYTYFCWVVKNRLDKNKKTYSVLSPFVR